MKTVYTFLTTYIQYFSNRNAKCEVCEVCKLWKVKYYARFEQIAYFAWIAFCIYHIQGLLISEKV